MAHVTIIGSGNMGRGLATRFLAAGADVQILSQTAEHAVELAAELGGAGTPAARGTATGGGMDEALGGDVVVLATPYDSALELAGSRAQELTGRIVVDITNPVDFATFESLVTPPDSSAAEEIAQRAPGAQVVKAFNTTFAATLETGQVNGQPLDVLLAADYDRVKREIAALVEAAGMRAIDVGPLRRARQLEHLGFLHMAMQSTLGGGHATAVKILRP